MATVAGRRCRRCGRSHRVAAIARVTRESSVSMAWNVGRRIAQRTALDGIVHRTSRSAARPCARACAGCGDARRRDADLRRAEHRADCVDRRRRDRPAGARDRSGRSAGDAIARSAGGRPGRVRYDDALHPRRHLPRRPRQSLAVCQSNVSDAHGAFESVTAWLARFGTRPRSRTHRQSLDRVRTQRDDVRRSVSRRTIEHVAGSRCASRRNTNTASSSATSARSATSPRSASPKRRAIDPTRSRARSSKTRSTRSPRSTSTESFCRSTAPQRGCSATRPKRSSAATSMY